MRDEQSHNQLERNIKGHNESTRYSNDRPPTVEEIRKLLLFPDRRIKPIVLVMIACGMRIGSWAYLKWGHIKPLEEDKVIKAARITIFNTKTKRFYNSLITPEAYEAVREWMEFRRSFGEKINEESWIMRNLWQIKSQRYGNYLGLAKHPKKLSVTAIRLLVNDAWKIQGLRDVPLQGNRYPFKSVQGFRKFFETECQKVMRELIVSTLMSHDTGIVMHYLRPKEEDILIEYQRAITLLTIDSDAILLNKQTQKHQKR